MNINIDKVVQTIKTANNHGYPATLIINGEYYGIDVKSENKDNQTLATGLCKALRTFAEKPENIDNFEYYLTQHFNKWFGTFACTPDGLVKEFNHFADME